MPRATATTLSGSRLREKVVRSGRVSWPREEGSEGKPQTHNTNPIKFEIRNKVSYARSHLLSRAIRVLPTVFHHSKRFKQTTQPALLVQFLQIARSTDRATADDDVGERIVQRPSAEQTFEIRCVGCEGVSGEVGGETIRNARRRSTSMMCGSGERRSFLKKSLAAFECL